MMSWVYVKFFIVMVVTSLMLVACTDEEVPDEQQVRNTIVQLETAIESGSVQQAVKLLSTDYSDKFHPRRGAAARSLFGYMQRHRNINLFSLVKQIDIADDGASAKVVVQVALTGVPVKSKETLFSIKADFYRFEIELKSIDDLWLISTAHWQRGALDLFED